MTFQLLRAKADSECGGQKPEDMKDNESISRLASFGAKARCRSPAGIGAVTNQDHLGRGTTDEFADKIIRSEVYPSMING